ncbi:hypothetical protein CapIbe_009749 [Capra ibex]
MPEGFRSAAALPPQAAGIQASAQRPSHATGLSLPHAESLLGFAPPFTSWASSMPPARGAQLQKGSTLLLAVKDPTAG